ncbi:MAG: O-antigen ligase family protein [Saprospiraceae bacterium]|nr:O-antigen ligase family protein [Saprospiraceae bacterium]
MGYLIGVYLIYNLSSGAWFATTGIPFMIYIKELSNVIFPMLFYYIGFSGIVNANKFYKTFVVSFVFATVVGMYLYCFSYGWYFAFLRRIEPWFNEEYYSMYGRMNSFLGSTAMGSISIIALVMAVCDTIKRGFSATNMLIVLLSIVSAVLSYQRSAVCLSIVAVCGLFTFGLIKRRIKLQYYITIIILAFGLILVAANMRPDYVESLWARVMSTAFAVSERKAQWHTALASRNYDWVLGNGLGAGGHKAMEFIEATVCDGSFVKMLVETGLVGCVLFAIINISTILRGMKCWRFLLMEVCIILVLLLQSIGSNVLAFQVILPIYWFCVGRIWRNEYNYDPVYGR